MPEVTHDEQLLAINEHDRQLRLHDMHVPVVDDYP